jgi:uncharacterized protein (TIGR02246 family)
MSEDERKIREVIETWMAATAVGDLPKVLSLMTDDVVFLVPGKEPFGKEAFASSSAAMKDMRVEGKSEFHELVVTGDWAFCRTHLQVTVTPPGKSAVRRSGYTLTLFKKQQNGSWLLARDANLLTADA